jgi:hypothetical protein
MTGNGIPSAMAAVLRVPPEDATTSPPQASLLATAEGTGAVGIALARPERAPGQALRGAVATRASADPISAARLSQDRVSAAPRLDLFRTRDSDRILAARASILLAAIGDLATEGSTDLATAGAEAFGQDMAGVASFWGPASAGVGGALAWDRRTGAAIGDPAGR